IWLKPNKNTPSVGNLILHLEGNVHQWINATLGNDKDIRNRDSEFNEASQPTKSELFNRLSTVLHQVESTLKNLDKDDLLQIYKVQAYEETGLHILIHVVEHFSYHVGQITHFVKVKKDIDTGYFSGLNLNQTN
ncbi:MAG: DinB family protein, partial [Candidatus Kariarchaeaceae archaeon]